MAKLKIKLGSTWVDLCELNCKPQSEKLFNCPNCGAAITGSKCEYCGTDFETISKLQ